MDDNIVVHNTNWAVGRSSKVGRGGGRRHKKSRKGLGPFFTYVTNLGKVGSMVALPPPPPPRFLRP